MAAPRKKPAGAAEQTRTVARARTPQQLDRQERAFELSVVKGKTVRQIAAELGCALETVVSDLRYEQQRRADEIAERREQEKARAVAFYDHVAAKALKVAEDAKMPGDSGRFGDAIKARERIDKILGIDAPTKVDLGLNQIIEAFEVPDLP